VFNSHYTYPSSFFAAIEPNKFIVWLFNTQLFLVRCSYSYLSLAPKIPKQISSYNYKLIRHADFCPIQTNSRSPESTNFSNRFSNRNRWEINKKIKKNNRNSRNMMSGAMTLCRRVWHGWTKKSLRHYSAFLDTTFAHLIATEWSGLCWVH
jgi:hypothetical protein